MLQGDRAREAREGRAPASVASRDRPRPLVVRVGELGDTILLTSLLRSLSEIWERPCDVIVKASWRGTVLAGLPTVGEVVGLASRRTPYWLSAEQRRLVAWLRRRGPSPTWVVDPLERISWLLARGGIAQGHTVTARDHPWRPLEHHLEFLWRLSGHLPAAWPAPPRQRPPAPPPPELVVTAREADDCRAWLSSAGWHGEPIVVVQTQSRTLERGRWRPEHWITTIGRVLDRLGGSLVLLIGTAGEAGAVRPIARACSDPRVRQATAGLGVRRLFALLSLAHSCLSLDTGPAHAAVVLGCPTVVLAGIADPRRYRPLGPPGRVAVVTSFAGGVLPSSPEEFAARHRTAEIDPRRVLEAWERVTSTIT